MRATLAATRGAAGDCSAPCSPDGKGGEYSVHCHDCVEPLWGLMACLPWQVLCTEYALCTEYTSYSVEYSIGEIHSTPSAAKYPNYVASRLKAQPGTRVFLQSVQPFCLNSTSSADSSFLDEH